MPIERTVSEDSDTSIGMDKTCSLCYRGERSLLGQGDLSRYEPTPGFNAFKQQVRRRGSLDMDEKLGDRSPKHLTWRRNRGPPKNPRQSYASAGGSSCNVDELNLVGLPDDVDVAHVFEKSGKRHVYAHHCCAAWSEGVLQADDCSLQYVDRAVLTGLSQKCTFCKRYGATIQCRYPKCSQRFHYPCASGGGCFQDIKTLSLLCPDHIDQAESIAGPEALCIVCDVPGCISDQLFCTSCGQHYHGNCLDPPVQVNPVVRSGWQCPECKICQTCRQPGDDNKMLVCDTCDKGYHIFCLRPVMTTIPKNGWKCKVNFFGVFL
ncbi:hypothetical protein CAPTEDRAFT_106026 [Capitella teleta]|uniref:PHD-type domain-containing protein n=1 Tax=Capitella teleta TaxID=283909 RepID=R7U190_CAPTE|nr:hypothetical protein CAPTEDRAFT_106026 [Capitella teleta]|eukprot:ELT96955.1 hypothetical protein CAPTEDRAFT_106026 [Capitella teleta]